MPKVFLITNFPAFTSEWLYFLGSWPKSFMHAYRTPLVLNAESQKHLTLCPVASSSTKFGSVPVHSCGAVCVRLYQIDGKPHSCGLDVCGAAPQALTYIKTAITLAPQRWILLMYGDLPSTPSTSTLASTSRDFFPTPVVVLTIGRFHSRSTTSYILTPNSIVP